MADGIILSPIGYYLGDGLKFFPCQPICNGREGRREIGDSSELIRNS